jgi:hypothetical protein
MLTKTRIKWGVSIILAGILLILALIGSKWGTTYAANIEDNPVPSINFIVPDKIASGSPDRMIFISGANFDSGYTRVRIVGNGIDKIVDNDGYYYPNSIWVTVPSDLLMNPTTYDITVVVSYGDPRSIPTIPVTPWDVESNLIPVEVYEVFHTYLPIMLNNTEAQ